MYLRSEGWGLGCVVPFDTPALGAERVRVVPVLLLSARPLESLHESTNPFLPENLVIRATLAVLGSAASY